MGKVGQVANDLKFTFLIVNIKLMWFKLKFSPTNQFTFLIVNIKQIKVRKNFFIRIYLHSS